VAKRLRLGDPDEVDSKVLKALDAIASLQGNDDSAAVSNAEVYDMTTLLDCFSAIANTIREGFKETSLTSNDIERLRTGGKGLESILSDVGMPDGDEAEQGGQPLLLRRCAMQDVPQGYDTSDRWPGVMTYVLTESGSIEGVWGGNTASANSVEPSDNGLFTVYSKGDSNDSTRLRGGFALPSLESG
jgi:hypothetical protein